MVSARCSRRSWIHTLRTPRKCKSIDKLQGSVVIKESTSGVAAALHLDQGKLEPQHDAIAKPTAYMEAGFENLAYISSGRISPIMALLTRKVKARGNLLILMKIAPLMVLKD